ncbi:MAG: hypothetical protein IKP22_09520 [Clostridia bacterium]|nr:hypothetical protein [Clostridia bacterium]
MKKITCIIIALVVLMSISFASAEEVECQMRWEELIRKYADQLSPEERFIANRMYDGLGNTTPEQTEIREALAQVDSLDKIQALIGNGVFDLDQPFVHDEAIKEQIQTVLVALGYTDLHIFIQHFNNGHYMNEQGWFVQGGRTVEEEGLTDFVIDFECYFYGDNLKLAYFFNKNLIAEPQNTW